MPTENLSPNTGRAQTLPTSLRHWPSQTMISARENFTAAYILQRFTQSHTATTLRANIWDLLCITHALTLCRATDIPTPHEGGRSSDPPPSPRQVEPT